MEKLKMETPDWTSENIEKIGELFPNCITETKDEDGNLRKAINFDVLKQMLSKDVVQGNEAYEFTWVGKKASMVEANKPIRKTLRPCKEESKDWDNTENLYIEGDNLEVLKLLQESYLGKVKMIYIDPPYNTGNDFIYNDDFKVSRGEYEEESGVIDEMSNKLFKNTDSNGRFHSDWCSMLYSRLMVARSLLCKEGVIFISIDDNEQDNLKKMCDEIFGEQDFITNFIFEKTQHFGRQKVNSYSNVDYVLCYAKELFENGIKELIVEKINTELLDAPLYNASNNINEIIFPSGKVRFNIKNGVYTKTESEDYELLDQVVVENGINLNSFTLRFRSRWANKTVQEEIKKGTTFWVKTKKFAIRAIYGDGKTTNVSPRQIIFTNTRNPLHTKSRFDSRIDTTENATSDLIKLMGGNQAMFSYSKPVSLMKYLASLVYDEKNKQFDKDHLILDFFSGSSTTAHAVMELNAEDDGNRKFIMVQLPEETDEKSEAYKAGYKNICEIGKERIRRAGEKIKEDNKDKEGIDQLDIGFRVLKLDDTNMKDVYYSPNEMSQGILDQLESNIKEDRTELDLLFGCLLEWGLPLSRPYKSEEMDGVTIHTYNEGDLIACFNEDIPQEVIREIARRKPLRVVFRDSSFKDSPDKINVEEIFKLLAPDTSIRVL